MHNSQSNKVFKAADVRATDTAAIKPLERLRLRLDSNPTGISLTGYCRSCRHVHTESGEWFPIEDMLTHALEAKHCGGCQPATKRKTGEAGLSPRELEVLGWIRNGKSTGEIGGILNISQSTVKFHAAKIMRKLNAINRTQAVAIAIARGIIDHAEAE